jgi:cysteine-S-conjugate beta-lyase
MTMDDKTTNPPSPTLTAETALSQMSLLPIKPKYRPSTECVVLPASNDPYNASSTPIYQTATFKQTSVSEMGEYDYSRSGNPTRSQIEVHLAKLMKADRALCISSGMSALDIITRLVKTGEEIVAGDDIYGGTNRLLAYLTKQNNVVVHHVDTTDLAAVRSVLNKNTKLVLLETPTNPLMKVCDITSISALVHELTKGIVVVDNTMMSPYLQNPLELVIETYSRAQT